MALDFYYMKCLEGFHKLMTIDNDICVMGWKPLI